MKNNFKGVPVRATSALILFALTSSACYQYFPVHETDPLPDAGAEVRLQLDSPQALDLGTMTINDVSTLEGHVRQSSSDSLSLFSNKLRTYYGFRQHTSGAVFNFDRDQFARVEQRKLVAWKTGVAVGVTTVGLAILMSEAVDWGGGSSEGNPGGVEPNLNRTTQIPINALFQLLFP